MVSVSEHLDVGVEDGEHLVLGDAAKRRVLWHHGYIAKVVQRGEDAQLAELGDAGDEDELLVLVAHLHHLVEFLHDASHLLQLAGLVKVIQQGRIVFVYDDHMTTVFRPISLCRPWMIFLNLVPGEPSVFVMQYFSSW